MPQSKFDVVCKKIRMVYKSKHETQNDFVAFKEKSIRHHMGINQLEIRSKIFLWLFAGRSIFYD